MRIFRFLLLAVFLFFVVPAGAQEASLMRTAYTPARLKGSVQFFLEDISKQTGVQFSYSDDLVKRRRPVRLNGTERSIEDVLALVLDGTGLDVIERGGKLLLVPGQSQLLAGAPMVTISGIVKDSASKEVIIGAVVYVPKLQAGTTTNAYGFYSLTLPAGQHELIISSLSYKADSSHIRLKDDLRRDVLLSYGMNLAGVTVSSQKDAPNDHIHLNIASVTNHAGLLGENDVMRALQYQPGIQSGTEGTASVNVRGGDPGQNLNLLDGTPLYYVDHFFSLTSIFNSDAVKSVDFYKGAFPARYGGRVSSIIDVSSKDGNMERVSGQASIGLVKGSLILEGPIIKDKASVMVAARRTWIDMIWKPFTNDLGGNFYDVNVKANYIINKNNRVYGSFYTGRDFFKASFFDDEFRILWGNTIGSARWTSIVSPRLFVNTTFSYSYFRYGLGQPDMGALADSNGKRPQYQARSEVNDRSLRVQADYHASARHRVQFGAQYSLADFMPVSVSFNDLYPEYQATNFRSNELLVYAEDEFKPVRNFSIRAGLHLATWLSSTFSYSSLQPRLYTNWQLRSNQSVYASATRMSQFLHLLGSTTSIIPTDFWIPSTQKLAPEHSWVYALGYSRRFKAKAELSAEVYYKHIDNVVSYKGANSIFEKGKEWEDQLTQGTGTAYGLELFGRTKFGPLTTSLAYTLSWSWRQFDIMNEGSPFPYRYDRRHNIHAEAIYQRRPRFRATVAWTYMSGEAITLPDQAYPDFDNNLLGTPSMNGITPYSFVYTDRNNYRLPPIHRLDFALHFMRQRGRYFERTWTLGVYNAYAAKNVMGVTLSSGEGEPGTLKLSGVAILRFIPTISYTVKF